MNDEQCVAIMAAILMSGSQTVPNNVGAAVEIARAIRRQSRRDAGASGHRCVVCGVMAVSPEDGYDTCYKCCKV